MPTTSRAITTPARRSSGCITARGARPSAAVDRGLLRRHNFGWRCLVEAQIRPLARALAAGAALASAAAFAGPPSSLRPPMQNEFDHCTLMAEEHGNRSLSGSLRLELLIRKSGNVYAGFISNETGIDDRKLEGC